jgi:hypothetical protein
MALPQEVQMTFLAKVRTNNVRIVSVTAVVPASGAPGALKIAIADGALAVNYWLFSVSFDTPSGAAIFDYRFETPQAGGTVLIGDMHFEVASDAGWYPPVRLPIPILIPVSATNGLAVRQQTASGQTCNVTVAYMTGLGT